MLISSPTRPHRVLVVQLDVTQRRLYAGELIQRQLQLLLHPSGQHMAFTRPACLLLLLHQLTRQNILFLHFTLASKTHPCDYQPFAQGGGKKKVKAKNTRDNEPQLIRGNKVGDTNGWLLILSAAGGCHSAEKTFSGQRLIEQ